MLQRLFVLAVAVSAEWIGVLLSKFSLMYPETVFGREFSGCLKSQLRNPIYDVWRMRGIIYGYSIGEQMLFQM
jgi:hypothetical protein